MDSKITCDCGVNVLKKHLSRHNKSKRHLDFINKKSLNLTNAEDKEQEENDKEQEENDNEIESNESSETEEVVDVNTTKTRKFTNKYHLDAIRQKAIARIKEKKQAKIDKEMEIIKKAEQYDTLVKSLKEKEENEKRKKEEDRLREMEYKSQQYDKMVKEQDKNNAIRTLSNEKIIDSVKQQRLEYLLKYLQNPSYVH